MNGLIARTIEIFLLIFFISFIISFLDTGVRFVMRKISDHFYFDPFNIKHFCFKKEFFNRFRSSVFLLIILKIIELFIYKFF
ncbi:hypothetical protein SAMN03080614_1002155 [Anaerobranca gottschalkii DSM 13577]|uniref:Uncharacterized protein n=1 Tax=Anaerobranca gottschalkii DSM 13577 TaxID=1120990 RepID=A0A1H9YEA6_9FIRM|nr:hypothetical protein SAMN03080614_1002155 [Anaerobranca gottschalkii DSM 13577]